MKEEEKNSRRAKQASEERVAFGKKDECVEKKPMGWIQSYTEARSEPQVMKAAGVKIPSAQARYGSLF